MPNSYVVSSDGVRTAYDVAGTGPPMLLLHGFSHDRTMWARAGWVERLRAEFTVITADLRGCGASDKPSTPDAYSLAAHLDDLATILRAVDRERCIVWGWSLGATIALHLAARVDLVATVAAGTYFGPIFTADYVERRRNATRNVLQRARWSGLESWPAVEPEQVRGPLLLYSGTRDGNVVRVLERQRRSIEAVGAALQVLDGLDHLDLVAAVEPVAAVVMPFVRAAA